MIKLNLFSRKIFASFFLIFFTFCQSQVEFIQDSNFTEDNFFYLKKSPKEVELLYERPRKNFRFVGTVVMRNFNSNRIELEKLQEEMFKLKIDGVLIKKTFVDEVAPVVISSKNNEGMLLGYAETNKEMGKLYGYPFRYVRK